MWWFQAALAWLPTIAVAAMAAIAIVTALAQAPRAAKIPWIATVLVCGALAIAAAAWQQGRELAQLRDLSTHLGALARLLPGAPPANPEQTVDSLTTSIYTLNSRISDLQNQIDALREKAKVRSIDSDTATKLEDYLRPFGNHRVVVSCVPGDPEAFTYANQITNVLRTAGWDAHGPETTSIFGDAPAMGIKLYVRSGVAPDTAKILLDAFTRFDIPYKSGTTSNDAIPDNTTVELFVSHKP
jgi:outer membrane murein-binding lipoprotein Lpp